MARQPPRTRRVREALLNDGRQRTDLCRTPARTGSTQEWQWRRKVRSLQGSTYRKRGWGATLQPQLTQVAGTKCSLRSGKKRNRHRARENGLEPKSRGATAQSQLSDLAV